MESKPRVKPKMKLLIDWAFKSFWNLELKLFTKVLFVKDKKINMNFTDYKVFLKKFIFLKKIIKLSNLKWKLSESF